MSMPSSTTSESARTASAPSGKYLTVLLENESYAIPVLRVREIIRLTKITPVPQTPTWVSGVINLRGRVVAVVDLRAKFGMRQVDGERTCIVVVNVPVNRDRVINLGLVVDAVEAVQNIAAAEIEPTPDFGTTVDTTYLLGIAKSDQRVNMLLDIDHVVGGDAMPGLARLAA